MRYDFSPLYRSTVGFDRLFSLFDEEIENAAVAHHQSVILEDLVRRGHGHDPTGINA